jgi:hypothetical protein
MGARKRDHLNWRGVTWKWCRRKVAISVSLQMDARTSRRSARALPVAVGEGDFDQRCRRADATAGSSPFVLELRCLATAQTVGSRMCSQTVTNCPGGWLRFRMLAIPVFRRGPASWTYGAPPPQGHRDRRFICRANRRSPKDHSRPVFRRP